MTLISSSPEERVFCYLIGYNKKSALLRYHPTTGLLSPPGGIVDYEKHRGPQDAMRLLFREQTGVMIPLPSVYAVVDHQDREGKSMRHFFFRQETKTETPFLLVVPEGQQGLEWIDMGNLFYTDTDPYTQFLLPMALQMGNIGEQQFQVEAYYQGTPPNRRY